MRCDGCGRAAARLGATGELPLRLPPGEQGCCSPESITACRFVPESSTGKRRLSTNNCAIILQHCASGFADEMSDRCASPLPRFRFKRGKRKAARINRHSPLRGNHQAAMCFLAWLRRSHRYAPYRLSAIFSNSEYTRTIVKAAVVAMAQLFCVQFPFELSFAFCGITQRCRIECSSRERIGRCARMCRARALRACAQSSSINASRISRCWAAISATTCASGAA